MEAIHNYYVSAGIVYENKKWDSYFSDKYTTSLKHEFSAKGSITGSIDIGPKTYVTINGLAGPYLDLKMTSDLTFCLGTQNAENLNWGINMNVGGKVTAGVHAYMFKEKLFDESVTWENRKLYNEKFPYTLGYVSGDNQQYAVGTPLESPLKVQVLSKQGRYAPNVFVTFEVVDNSGTLSKTEVKTNNQGFAEVNFTPSVSGGAHVKAYVKDCDFNYLQYAPITFSAKEKTDASAGCSQTTLSASYSIGNNLIKPVAHLGNPPYQYSVNDSTFSSAVPELHVSEKENYNITIKDASGCTAYVSYTDLPEYNPSSCHNSTLRISSLNENGNTITVKALGGTLPYLYSKDGINYTSSTSFLNLSNGQRTFFVKDSNGCIATIYGEVTGAPTLKDLNNYSYAVTNVGNNWWSAENYRYQGVLHEGNTNYGSYYDLGNLTIPQGWRLPSKEDFDNLLNQLGSSAFATLTSELGFDAKPFGYLYRPSYDAPYGITRNNEVAIFKSSTRDISQSSGLGYSYYIVRTYCLVIDFTQQKATVEYLNEYYQSWSMGRYDYNQQSLFNARLIKLSN